MKTAQTKTIRSFMKQPVDCKFYMTNKACDASFVRHLRNSFAHGRIRKRNNTVVITDVNPDNQQITMYGQLPYNKFQTLVTLIMKSI